MRLSRDRIVEAALGLVEREGWDALSMRRLAQELDVWPMAVYRYFQDKDALVEGLVDAAAESVELPGRRGSWRTRMRALLHGARDALRRPPGGLAIGAGRRNERLAGSTAMTAGPSPAIDRPATSRAALTIQGCAAPSEPRSLT